MYNFPLFTAAKEAESASAGEGQVKEASVAVPVNKRKQGSWRGYALVDESSVATRDIFKETLQPEGKKRARKPKTVSDYWVNV